MTPQVISLSAAGSTAWIPVDYKQNPFNIGFAVVIPSGTLTYQVEHTFDDIFNSSVTPTAFTHSSIFGKTTNQDGNYAFPVRAVRLTITSWTSGSAILTLLQGAR